MMQVKHSVKCYNSIVVVCKIIVYIGILLSYCFIALVYYLVKYWVVVSFFKLEAESV